MEEDKRETVRKKVDDAWKDAVEKEKVSVDGGVPKDPEVTFGLFISSLMMEALVALGELENPVTKKKEPNHVQAKFIIDTLGMLKEKTKNNLAKDESESIDAILYELRMRFVEKFKK